jgi:hypothetical protein
MDAITTADRGELVGLDDADTLSYLGDALNWLRDFAAKGARAGADTLDDWTVELDRLQLPVGGLQEYLRQQDNWIADMFAEVLAIVEVVNPLTVGKQIAIWILEDFRDLLRALATLIDTKDETAEQTQDALTEIALAGAALAVPYVGRAGKIIARIFKGLPIEEGLAMLRHIDAGDVVKYLQQLNLPQYLGKITGLLQKIVAKIGDKLGRWMPKVKQTLDDWFKSIKDWIGNILAKIQAWLNQALAAIQKKIYDAYSNLTNSKLLDKMPDQLLDWVAQQINGNLCESCVDNYLVNFMQYARLFPAPNASKRDASSFFGPDQGIDGVFEKPPAGLASPGFPAKYNGIPLSFGAVLDELGFEVEGETIPRLINNSIKPFGSIPTDFSPTTKKPPRYPQFVVMEAKFGYHQRSSTNLNNNEWERKLGTTASGQRQMSKRWIEARFADAFPPVSGGQRAPKHIEILKRGYARWLYACQPHKAENSKTARARGGKRVVGMAFLPPYALRGFDIDAMPGWNV